MLKEGGTKNVCFTPKLGVPDCTFSGIPFLHFFTKNVWMYHIIL